MTHSGHDLDSNVSSEKAIPELDRPSSPTYSESVEEPLLAEEGGNAQNEGISESSPATGKEDDQKSALSGAEYKIACSHFLVSFIQSSSCYQS